MLGNEWDDVLTRICELWPKAVEQVSKSAAQTRIWKGNLMRYPRDLVLLTLDQLYANDTKGWMPRIATVRKTCAAAYETSELSDDANSKDRTFEDDLRARWSANLPNKKNFIMEMPDAEVKYWDLRWRVEEIRRQGNPIYLSASEKLLIEAQHEKSEKHRNEV